MAFFRRPGRWNLFLLPDGTIVFRERRKAPRGIKIASGFHNHELGAIKRLFFPMTDGRFTPLELYPLRCSWMGGDGTIPAERLRIVARLYRNRIDDFRKGRPAKTAEPAFPIVMGRV